MEQKHFDELEKAYSELEKAKREAEKNYEKKLLVQRNSTINIIAKVMVFGVLLIVFLSWILAIVEVAYGGDKAQLTFKDTAIIVLSSFTGALATLVGVKQFLKEGEKIEVKN